MARTQYFDQGNFAAGNGGYITLGSKQLNLSKWAVNWKNTIVPTPCTGSAGIMTYRTVGTTALVHIEMCWDFSLRNEGFVGSFNDPPVGLNVDSNMFGFYGVIADKSNTNNVTKGYMCSQVAITSVTVVSSQEQDDVVKVVIEGVANAPLFAF